MTPILVRNSCAFPDRPLPRAKDGVPVPDVDAPHAQLDAEPGRNGSYPQTREFDADGNPVRNIDFTDHGRMRNHPNPHQRTWQSNPTVGKPQRALVALPLE
ncbi:MULTISPECIES: hypothetical protein [Amycolatopsis]|uniref:Uncharacterized protein n=1 Tax=Amycolatopsis dongchuanensis TaxID=1070866 RepID=A0ABP9Q3P8_9PSEU|nr:hypothetical protein [Amycolatopsis sacchari]